MTVSLLVVELIKRRDEECLPSDVAEANECGHKGEQHGAEDMGKRGGRAREKRSGR